MRCCLVALMLAQEFRVGSHPLGETHLALITVMLACPIRLNVRALDQLTDKGKRQIMGGHRWLEGRAHSVPNQCQLWHQFISPHTPPRVCLRHRARQRHNQ